MTDNYHPSPWPTKPLYPVNPHTPTHIVVIEASRIYFDEDFIVEDNTREQPPGFILMRIILWRII